MLQKINYLLHNAVNLRGTLGRIALITLLVLVGTIPLSGVTQSFAAEPEVPDWVKTTLALWSNGELVMKNL
mgnify:FL=1|jgi:hypothetical protein